MNTKLLIDALVHQTVVLIARLSTAAGIRAPLAHIANQVFLELSREIEAQGVSRKVAADMFGLATRTYQKKVQRLTESVTVRGRTLWQAVLDYLHDNGSASRRELLQHFNRDDEVVVGSVLNDLVSSGLVFRTGLAESAVFGVTRAPDLQRALQEQRRESLAPIVWAIVYRAGGASRESIREQVHVDDSLLDEALRLLQDNGQIRLETTGADVRFSAKEFLVPVGAEHGWEAAVFDHFQAVVRAIGSKVTQGRAHSSDEDIVGGATFTFDIHDNHPQREEVLGLLKRVRADINQLWHAVEQHNQTHPIGEQDEGACAVSFYFGQSVTSSDEDEA